MTAGDWFLMFLLLLGAVTHVVIFALGMQELFTRFHLWRLKRALAKHNRPTWPYEHPHDWRGMGSD